jgi:uncharacterized repeat protein (TIGR03803 family)
MQRLLAAIACLLACSQTGLAADNLTILHQFDTNKFADGYMPPQGVYYDAASNALYGTTEYGGEKTCHEDNGCGVVFALTAGDNGQLTKYNRLHVFDFGAKDKADGDGGDAVILDSAGNLYGTNQQGGDPNCANGLGCGMIYMLEAPLLGGHSPQERVLHVFEDSDGRFPYGGLILDPKSGALYGTTVGGGSGDRGTVFSLAPAAGKTGWTFTVLYNFRGAPDGDGPASPLIMDGQGDLWGATEYGGAGKGFGDGAMFSLQPGEGGWKERVALRFHLRSDGQHPFPGLAADGQGNFFAATDAGCGKRLTKPCGYALELSPQGKNYDAKIIHTFYWADGSTLYGGALTRDSAGDLFGVAAYGGANGDGSAYELQNAGGAYTFVKLYDFCSESGCSDGALPYGLVMDAHGNLYGTTIAGGVGDAGEVFMLSAAK